MHAPSRNPLSNGLLLFLFALFHLHPASTQPHTVNNHTKSPSLPALPTLDEIISNSLKTSFFPGPNGVPSKYVRDMKRVTGPADSWLDLMCAAGEVRGCPARKNFPGPSSRSPVRWAAVSRLVALLPYKQWSGEWWRGSETSSTITAPMYHTHPDTGEAILNPMSFSLGMLPSQHVVIRPVLEAAFTLEKKTKKERKDIERYAERMLRTVLNDAKERGRLVKMDVQIWFQKTINMIVFGREVSTEYVEGFYKDLSGLGKTFVSSNAVPKKYWPRDLLGMEAFRRTTFRYTEEFKPLIRKRYGHLFKGKDCSPSRSCLDQAAHALFEPMRSLAIPNTLYIALGLLYSTDQSNPAGSETLSYASADAELVYREVLRLFPPARTLPFWPRRPPCIGLTPWQTSKLNVPHGHTRACPLPPVDKQTGFPPVNQYRGGRRTLLNLATALQDGGAWGRDAGVFKVRNRATYEKLGVGFAEQAVNESIANGGMDRKCPAKQLALLLGKVFLSVFEKEDWFVSVGETGFQMRTGGLYTPGMTLLYARNETNCLESKCKCGLSKMGSAKEDNGRVCQWTKRFCNNCLKMNNYCRFM